MEIVMIAVFFSLLCWTLCAVSPRDEKEDEEQERYLKDWERKHGK